MKQRILGLVFAFAVGLTAAWFVYQRVGDPQPRVERQTEERLVVAARDGLMSMLALDAAAEVVDPLAPNRVAGKVYIYPRDADWEVSGFYRAVTAGDWQPWLMRLSDDGEVLALRLSADDPLARERAADDARIVLQ